MKKNLKGITPIEQDFAKWYIDVIKTGNLIQYGLVKGTIIFKPIAFGIWDNIRTSLDLVFKKIEVKNVYLPMLIPLSEFEKEKEHVEGFAPELATVTRVGDKEILPVVLRPTSEILFGHFFKAEINSYKDLPIVYNQWANVIRWEKNTNPFLRTSEFLWQEGHTCYATPIEAQNNALQMIKVYANFIENDLAIAVLMGEKTEKERFAGAINTYTVETMMKDHKALQAGTSHYLGQNFSKTLDVSFTNASNKKEFVYQTSWGVSTRLIGALIMSHGDNNGIIIPPKIAPFQIDVIPVPTFSEGKLRSSIDSIVDKLSNKFRLRIIESDKSFGFRLSQSEVEGTPLRIEIGEKDIEKGMVTISRRDDFTKKIVKIEAIEEEAKQTLEAIQKNLFEKSKQRLLESIVHVNSYDEFKKHVKSSFVGCFFDGTISDEKLIQQETSATSRCIPFVVPIKLESKTANCIYTNKQTSRYVVFARAY